MLLYAAYFFFGAGIGAANFDRGLLAPTDSWRSAAGRWTIATLVPYCLMWVLIYIKREILGNPERLPDWYEATYGLFFVCLQRRHHVRDPGLFPEIQAIRLEHPRSACRPDAYGMFLVHYPIVLWLQYWLFDFDLPAIVKAAVAFVLTVALSWAATAALRKIPGATSGSLETYLVARISLRAIRATELRRLPFM